FYAGALGLACNGARGIIELCPVFRVHCRPTSRNGLPMRYYLRFWPLLAIAVLAFLPPGTDKAADPPKPPPLDYNRQVRPILADNCFACHGQDSKQRKKGLRLDTAK